MSLINDALKRAQEAHENLPPPPPTSAVPQFRPAEPTDRPGIGPGVLMLATLCILLLLGLLISWVWVQKNASTIKAQAAASPATPVSAPAVASPAPSVPPAVQPQDAAVAAPATPAAPVETVVVTPAPPAPAPPENTVVVPVEPPKPALKLQGIVYNPLRPAAMISGKTLFIGDRTGEWRVTAINPESATLVSGGQTNVLTLAQ
jgi:hypothetical protein